MDDDHESERMSEARFSRRAVLLGGMQAAAFSLVGWRLYGLQVRDQGRYVPLAEKNRISLQVLAPKRGRILDRNGRMLAENEEVFRATLMPGAARNIPRTLSVFRQIVPLTDAQAQAIAARAKKSGRSLPVLLASNLTFEQVAQINVLSPHMPGVRTEIIWNRKYRHGPTSGHVVGYVGSVEQYAPGDDAVTRLPQIRIGKYGAEKGFEALLKGAGGTEKIEIDARGRIIRNLETLPPVPGKDVSLSVDADLQDAISTRLQQERRAATVALDIESGEIAVMASTPGFESEAIAEGMTATSWKRLLESEDKPLINRAVAGQYPPAGVFKIVTALAALKAGKVSVDERIACTGHLAIGDETFTCTRRTGHGAVVMASALTSACDIYFLEIARRLGVEPIADAARLLGLATTYDCGIVEQAAGIVPDADWIRSRKKTGWSEKDTARTAIGQAHVLATPLQLAVMTARLAVGKAIVPSLAKRDADAPLPVFAALGIEDNFLASLRAAMTTLVNASGARGRSAQMSDGRTLVAGLDGDAQLGSSSGTTDRDTLPWDRRDHALFVAFAPAKNPKYAVASVIEHGGKGAQRAALLTRDVLDAVLKRDAHARANPTDATGNPSQVEPAREG